MKGIYLVGNYPNRTAFQERVQAVIDAGMDFLEVGIPFSDPVADGPVIADVMAKTLAAGATPADVVTTLRKLDTGEVPVFVMTYTNVVVRMDPASFSTALAGRVAGVILADCPNRMHPVLRKQGLTLPLVPFVTPESRESDVAALRDSDAPFIYFIGIRGITGSTAHLDRPEIRERVTWLKQVTGKPVVMGFGIRTRAQADTALAIADGCVIGTAAVSVQHNRDRFRSFLASLTGEQP